MILPRAKSRRSARLRAAAPKVGGGALLHDELAA